MVTPKKWMKVKRRCKEWYTETGEEARPKLIWDHQVKDRSVEADRRTCQNSQWAVAASSNYECSTKKEELNKLKSCSDLIFKPISCSVENLVIVFRCKICVKNNNKSIRLYEEEKVRFSLKRRYGLLNLKFAPKL